MTWQIIPIDPASHIDCSLVTKSQTTVSVRDKFSPCVVINCLLLGDTFNSQRYRVGGEFVWVSERLFFFNRSIFTSIHVCICFVYVWKDIEAWSMNAICPQGFLWLKFCVCETISNFVTFLCLSFLRSLPCSLSINLLMAHYYYFFVFCVFGEMWTCRFCLLIKAI